MRSLLPANPPSSVAARAIKRAKDVPEGILYARPGFALPNSSRPCGIDGWTLSHLRHPRHSSVVLLRWAHMSSLTSERREWKRDSRPDRPLNAKDVSLCWRKFSPGWMMRADIYHQLIHKRPKCLYLCTWDLIWEDRSFWDFLIQILLFNMLYDAENLHVYYIIWIEIKTSHISKNGDL